MFMRYKSFFIKNFKGIQSLTLDLEGKPPSKVFTLIGLNESGKTTILEALSVFYEGIKSDDDVELHESSLPIHSLVPKNLQDNFNDAVEIKAQVHLEDEDINYFKDSLLKIYSFTAHEISSEVTISFKYAFELSVYQAKNVVFNFDIVGRRKRGRKNIKIKNRDPEGRFFTAKSKKEFPK